MIKKVELSMKEDSREVELSSGVFATMETEAGVVDLQLADVGEYWDYAIEDDIEGISVFAEGDYVVAQFSVASGQGGVVTVWDEEGKLVHISNGEYGIASTIFKGYVYTLCGIMYYGHPLSYIMTRSPLGTMDAWAEAEVIEGFDLSDKDVYGAAIKGETIRLEAKDEVFTIIYGDRRILVTR